MKRTTDLCTGWQYFFIVAMVMLSLTIFHNQIDQFLEAVFQTELDIHGILMWTNIALLLVSPTCVLLYRFFNDLVGTPPKLIFMHPYDYFNMVHFNLDHQQHKRTHKRHP